MAQQCFHCVEIIDPSLAAGQRQMDQGLRTFAFIDFLLTYKSGRFQFRQMGGEVPIGCASFVFQFGKAGRIYGGEISHNAEPQPSVNDIINRANVYVGIISGHLIEAVHFSKPSFSKHTFF